LKRAGSIPFDVRQRVADELPRLLAYAVSLVRDRDRARELVQETATRALATRLAARDERALRAWLYKTLRHAAIDEARRQRQWLEQPVADAIVEQDPWRVENSRIAAITVRQGFARLGPEAREILALIDIAGFSYGETSVLLGIPIGTVMSRVSRARSALLQAVAESDVVPLRRRDER